MTCASAVRDLDDDFVRTMIDAQDQRHADHPIEANHAGLDGCLFTHGTRTDTTPDAGEHDVCVGLGRAGTVSGLEVCLFQGRQKCTNARPEAEGLKRDSSLVGRVPSAALWRPPLWRD
jgi:hypothetical protein